MQFLDLIFQRYSDPLTLLDGMILTGRLKEFVLSLLDIHNNEVEDKSLWEFYLHKVYDMSFVEFLRKNGKGNIPEKNQAVMVETVKASKQMLEGFIPPD